MMRHIIVAGGGAVVDDITDVRSVVLVGRSVGAQRSTRQRVTHIMVDALGDADAKVRGDARLCAADTIIETLRNVA